MFTCFSYHLCALQGLSPYQDQDQDIDLDIDLDQDKCTGQDLALYQELDLDLDQELDNAFLIIYYSSLAP